MRSRSWALPIAGLVALALPIAGCGGGGSSPGVATVQHRAASGHHPQQPRAGKNPQAQVLAFVACMRSHGVPDMPDPLTSPHGFKFALNPSNAAPAFHSAFARCQHLLPAGGHSSGPSAQESRRQIADMLSFARCMRSHGLANFPDPNAQSGLTVAMVEAQGIDVHSPAVLRVAQACIPASHGALTPAKIREAIANAGH
ncbi:MAG TPA: hypothetical protein VL977_07945 [Solirubrobacteraceae bacterium]|nr:hypothetical protein [Solirubrobacteraceae bacterium]